MSDLAQIDHTDYAPFPHQARLHASDAQEILFGGAAGPGKSKGLREELAHWCARIGGLQAFLFRRTFPELEHNHVLPLLSEFPQGAFQYNRGKNRFEFANGSILHLCHCQREADRFRYHGAEIHVLGIDEVTTFTELIYTYLLSRVRCTLDVPSEWRHCLPRVVCATNPGGIGHEWVKRRWVDFCGAKGGLRRAPRSEGGLLREFIPCTLADNPILLERNPHYLDQLNALPEPYRTAYLKGDWDIFLGQMFAFNRKDHVLARPIPIPPAAPLLFTYDYGFGKPFSCGYWWIDQDSRLYRFAELYGAQPGPPFNVGLRWSHDEQAEAILAKEVELHIEPGRLSLRLAGPDAFNKTPDLRGGGQGPSTAEDFARHGIILRPGDPIRSLKIRQFHARLRVKLAPDGEPEDWPMMMVYPECEDFIRTIPVLAPSPANPEDVDTRQEDHIYDEAALACMAFPLGGPPASRARARAAAPTVSDLLAKQKG
jgi:hypothetical protein